MNGEPNVDCFGWIRKRRESGDLPSRVTVHVFDTQCERKSKTGGEKYW